MPRSRGRSRSAHGRTRPPAVRAVPPLAASGGGAARALRPVRGSSACTSGRSHRDRGRSGPSSRPPPCALLPVPRPLALAGGLFSGARAGRPGLRPFPSARRRGMVPPMSNLFSIDGKVALVTGGSRGIGGMIARGFVEAGAKVYISARKAEVCDQVAAELSRQGAGVFLPADCPTEAGARGLADALPPRAAGVPRLG